MNRGWVGWGGSNDLLLPKWLFINIVILIIIVIVVAIIVVIIVVFTIIMVIVIIFYHLLCIYISYVVNMLKCG